MAEEIYAVNRTSFRKWLSEHHDTCEEVWLILYKKKSGKASIDWAGAVKEALCYGWIDSLKKGIDDEKWKQRFTPRKPKSVWSKVNKDYIRKLIEEGLMTEYGLEKIRIAKENGSWESLDKIEALEMPPELEAALDKYPGSRDNYEKFPKTVKKSILYHINIKNEEERLKRSDTTARLAAENIRNDSIYRLGLKKKEK